MGAPASAPDGTIVSATRDLPSGTGLEPGALFTQVTRQTQPPPGWIQTTGAVCRDLDPEAGAIQK